ncbi:hypothetical protein ACTWPT_07915 [Nonomuraea sp. 3N208]|uniref:hypothetical protein n=1 Tax=Nonomuraea sp. 3N208 TaxID=3457421 RepID=UPI003FCD01DC
MTLRTEGAGAATGRGAQGMQIIAERAVAAAIAERDDLPQQAGGIVLALLPALMQALHSARLITQRRRGEYGLAPQAMIQVLTILAAAFDLANDPPLGPPTDLPNPE